MSKPLVKKHSYKDINFEITVNLNFKIERSLDGKREHLVTLKQLGTDIDKFLVVNTFSSTLFSSNFLCETQNLEETIKSAIHAAEKWVDNQFNKEKTVEELILINLGFNEE